jgi:hypothetical protein
MEQQIDKEIAKKIYHCSLKTMKFTLEMEEYGYKEQGRNDPRYKHFKKMLMQETYNNLRELFSVLEEIGLVIPTEYEEDLKNGWKDTLSGGSSFLNSEEANKILL